MVRASVTSNATTSTVKIPDSALCANLTYRSACLRNTRNTSLSQWVDKHAVKAFARRRSMAELQIAVPATVAYARAGSEISVSNSALVADTLSSLRWGARLIFKATHLSGGVMLVGNSSVTCLRSPCISPAQPNKGLTGNPKLGFSGTIATTSIATTLDVMRSTCAYWLSHAYHGNGVEIALYRGVRRGCMLESAIHPDPSAVGNIKFFCFDGVCPCAQVTTSQFHVSTGEASGQVVEQAAKRMSRGYFSLPGWSAMKVYTGHKGLHRQLVDWRPPLFAPRLIEHAQVLSSGFSHVRVDFMFSVDGPVFNELTFAPSACGEQFEPRKIDCLYAWLAWGNPPREAAPHEIETEQLRLLAVHERSHKWVCHERKHKAGGGTACYWT